MRNILLALLIVVFAFPAFAAEKGNRESAYDRVMRTGTIRCGYIVYPPYLDRDVNTGKFSGIWFDLMEKLGRELSLKIEWTEETGTANAFTALSAGRFDALCTGALAVPARTRVVNFTTPFYYDALYVVSRADDKRFDEDLRKIDASDVKVYVLEGETAQFLTQEEFPHATLVMQANLTDPGARFMDIISGKGDVTLVTIANFRQFERNNPGKLKLVGREPMWVGQAGIVVPKGEFDLWAMLGTVVDHLNNTGFTRRTIQKYDNVVLPVARPYEVTK